MWGFCIGMIVGIIQASLVAWFVSRSFKVGTLRVDRSDPDDEPYMFLELSKNIGDVSNKKYVVLKVSNENYISQK